MLNARRLNIVAPVSSLSGRTRLSKIAQYFHRERSAEICFFGWLRNSSEFGEKYLDFSVRTEHLVFGGGYASRANKIKYVLWAIKCFILALRIPKRETIWALGFESAFPIVLAGVFKQHVVIFDDADRFSLAFPIPKPINRLVKKMEEWVSRRVTVHLIPGKGRYDFESDKFFVLKNTPSARELEKAKILYSAKEWPSASLVININGWLGADRGLPIILSVANRLIGKDILFLVAGKPDCAEAKELFDFPNVVYLGQLSNAEALASYFASDYVLTYYSPVLEINCLAESNKWGDAIHTGVGVIANKEVVSAGFLSVVECGLFPAYFDSDALVAGLLKLAGNRQLLSSHKSHSASLREQYPLFEEQLARLVTHICRLKQCDGWI